MKNNFLNENELKMIKTFKINHNEKIILYFFNKYKDDAITYLNYKILNKWYQAPFEKQDFVSFIWKAIKKTLINFDVLSLKNQIKGIVFKIAYDLVKREKLKLLTNGHKILNQAYSLEKMKENFWNNNILIDKNQNLSLKKLDVNLFLDKIVSVTKGNKKYFYKRIIYLKSCGFNNKAIAAKLNLKPHQIRYILDLLANEGKKYFKKELVITKRHN